MLSFRHFLPWLIVRSKERRSVKQGVLWYRVSYDMKGKATDLHLYPLSATRDESRYQTSSSFCGFCVRRSKPTVYANVVAVPREGNGRMRKSHWCGLRSPSREIVLLFLLLLVVTASQIGRRSADEGVSLAGGPGGGRPRSMGREGKWRVRRWVVGVGGWEGSSGA